MRHLLTGRNQLLDDERKSARLSVGARGGGKHFIIAAGGECGLEDFVEAQRFRCVLEVEQSGVDVKQRGSLGLQRRNALLKIDLAARFERNETLDQLRAVDAA